MMGLLALPLHRVTFRLRFGGEAGGLLGEQGRLCRVTSHIYPMYLACWLHLAHPLMLYCVLHPGARVEQYMLRCRLGY